MTDGLETNKLISAATGISVETRLQTPGEATADSTVISPYALCLPLEHSVILSLKSILFPSVLLANVVRIVVSSQELIFLFLFFNFLLFQKNHQWQNKEPQTTFIHISLTLQNMRKGFCVPNH